MPSSPPDRIVVAEETSLLRRVLGDALRERGYEVLEAAHGDLALELVRREHPAALLLARDLTGLCGHDVLDAVLADPATADVPVVFVTGRTDPAAVAESLERGAFDYVRKPVEPVELVARVRNAVRLRRLTAELERQNVELELLAQTDALTGLANRRYASEHLARAIATAARHGVPLSVVLLDIDHFKAVNDTHGHAAGDAVLREVARRVAGALRTEDLAARWGGEEFLLQLSGAQDGSTVCERAREAIACAPVLLEDGRAITVTSSFGWSTWEPRDSAEELVARADAALYEAKERGRNRVVAAAMTA